MNTIDKIFRVTVKTLIVLGLVMAIHNSIMWKDSIRNPANDPYIVELAFNLGIEKHEVTQADFNRRYLNN